MGTWTMETAMESERVHEMCRNGCDRQMRQSGSGREDVVSSRNGGGGQDDGCISLNSWVWPCGV
jgi:hypothetical protein